MPSPIGASCWRRGGAILAGPRHPDGHASPAPKSGGVYGSASQLDSQSGGGPTVHLLTREQSVTWFFKTREGGAGVLQLAGFTDNPRGVQIRYQLASSAPAAARTAELEFRLVAAEGDTRVPADELADPNDRTGQTKLGVLKEVLLDLLNYKAGAATD